MSEKGSYFEKSYKPSIKIDDKLVTDFFNIVGTMNLNEIKQFVMIENIPFNVYDRFGNNLIHHVLLENDLLKTESQRLLIIKYLYDEHVNPDAPNNLNQTPLHIACIKQYMSIIKFLVEIGVDINYKDNFGNTPLHKLFSGNIKLEEKTSIGNIVPLPKIQDKISKQSLTEANKKLWESIKNSKFIESIKNTVEYSFNIQNDAVDIILKFQQGLSQIINNNKNDVNKAKQLAEDFYRINYSGLKQLIIDKWNNFELIDDINIHIPSEKSYSFPEKSETAIIKNSNSKAYLIELIEKSFSLIQNINYDVINKIDINELNNKYTLEYLNNNLSSVLNDADLRNINKNNGQYKYKDFDFSQNIIEISDDDNYFIGGPRICNIIEPLTIDQVIYLENLSLEERVNFIMYNMFLSFDDLQNLLQLIDPTNNELINKLNNYDLMTNIFNNIKDKYTEDNGGNLVFNEEIKKLFIDIQKQIIIYINSIVSKLLKSDLPSDATKLDNNIGNMFIDLIENSFFDSYIENSDIDYIEDIKQKILNYINIFNFIFTYRTINFTNIFKYLKEINDPLAGKFKQIETLESINELNNLITSAPDDTDDTGYITIINDHKNSESDLDIKNIIDLIAKAYETPPLYTYDDIYSFIKTILEFSQIYIIDVTNIETLTTTIKALSDTDVPTNKTEIDSLIAKFTTTINNNFNFNIDKLKIYKLIDKLKFTDFENIQSIIDNYNKDSFEYKIAEIFNAKINEKILNNNLYENRYERNIIGSIICKYIENPTSSYSNIIKSIFYYYNLYDETVELTTYYFLYDNLDVEMKNNYFNESNLSIIKQNYYNKYRDYNLLSKYNSINLDKINWLYSFVTEFLSLMHPDHNLECNMRMSIILLFAGLINKKSNFELSIRQSMRIILHPLLFKNNQCGFSSKENDNTKYGSLLSAWLYILLSEQTSTNIKNVFDTIYASNDDVIDENVINSLEINQQLRDILENTFNLMNGDIKKNIIERNNLCNSIIEYYKNMSQKPQYCHIADVLKLIKNTDSNIVARMKTLIITNNIPNDNEIEMIEPNFIEDYNEIKLNNEFINIISQTDPIIFINLWSINEYALPSRLNYFLFKTNEEYNMLIQYINDSTDYELNIDNINNNKKFIECYYLGLNYLGHVSQVNNITEITNSAKNLIEPEIDLFNFNISEKPIEDTYNVYELDYFHRPMTNFNISINLNIFEVKINYLIKSLIIAFNQIITEFNNTKNSNNYALAVSYIYPYLVNLYNYSQIFKIYNDLFKTDDDDISNLLDSFEIFNLQSLELYLNNINAYIFLLYYLSATNLKMKIPKLFYYSFGNDYLILYNKTNEQISININDINADTTDADTNTKKLDDQTKLTGLYQNIIKNIGFINKNIMDELFIMSKEKKLPPSINNYLYNFYRINLIELIKSDTTEINYEILKELETTKQNKNILLLFIKANLIQDLVRSYLLFEIEKEVQKLYTKFISTTKISIPDNIKQLLINNKIYKVEFKTDVSSDLINNIQSNTNNITSLKYFYSFVEPKKIKEQFYIYPDNYFGTNLLNTKYVININDKIIEYMMQQNCNITCHNNEKVSPLVMFMRNKYYKGLEIIKHHTDLRDFYTDKIDSPYKYLLNMFKLHLEQYSINFINYQYDEIEQLVQSNENFYNNIMKNMKTSFKVVKYLTEQYLTENMLHFSDSFTSEMFTEIIDFSDIDYKYRNIDLVDIYYNKIISSLNVSSTNIGIIKNEILILLKDKQFKNRANMAKYTKELDTLKDKKINDTDINQKITILKTIIETNNINIKNLGQQRINKFVPLQLTNTTRNIIERYNNLIIKMNNQMLSYVTGWTKLVNKSDLYDENIDILASILIEKQTQLMQNININFTHNLNRILPFYELNHNIVKEYFENSRFINENEPLEFVNNLLIHITKTFICSNIESVIEKILYEYFANTTNDNIDSIIDKITYMVSIIKDELYNEIPTKFVKNSCNIFQDQNEKSIHVIETVSEILGNLIDKINQDSGISINEYTINIFKSNIIPYFDTIVYKLINNWNVVIENIFLFHINHFRILKCLKAILI